MWCAREWGICNGVFHMLIRFMEYFKYYLFICTYLFVLFVCLFVCLFEVVSLFPPTYLLPMGTCPRALSWLRPPLRDVRQALEYRPHDGEEVGIAWLIVHLGCVLEIEGERGSVDNRGGGVS